MRQDVWNDLLYPKDKEDNKDDVESVPQPKIMNSNNN